MFSSASKQNNRAAQHRQSSAESLRNGTIQAKAGAEQAPPPNRTGLPDNLKAGIENLSGHSMGDVKVHYNSAAPAQLQAHAYAQGTHIHLAPGQERHLPHEAWHVVQQKQGRVRPTLQMKSKVNVNDDKGLESEADTMGNRALQTGHGNPLQAKKTQPMPKSAVGPTVQRVVTNPGDNWIYHITPLNTFMQICQSQSLVPLNTILDKTNPETVSSGLDAQRGQNGHETKESHEAQVSQTKQLLDGLGEGHALYRVLKEKYDDMALGRKRDFVYGTIHPTRIDSYRNHYEKDGQRDDLVVLRWKGGEEEYHIDKEDDEAIKTLSAINISRCEVTRTVPRSDVKSEAKKALDEATWEKAAALYTRLVKPVAPKSTKAFHPAPFRVSAKNQYPNTNALLGRSGTAPSRAPLSQQDT